MAVFRVQTFKRIGTGRPWTNVWHVSAADLETAAGTINTIVNAEALLLSPTGVIFKAIVKEPGSPDFISVALGVVGAASGIGDLWPLFNTVRAIVTVAGFGRNDGKFLRGFLGDAITSGGIINPDTVVFVRNTLIDLLDALSAAGTPLVADDGSVWESIDVSNLVQMRQEHRKRRRAA